MYGAGEHVRPGCYRWQVQLQGPQEFIASFLQIVTCASWRLFSSFEIFSKIVSFKMNNNIYVEENLYFLADLSHSLFLGLAPPEILIKAVGHPP